MFFLSILVEGILVVGFITSPFEVEGIKFSFVSSTELFVSVFSTTIVEDFLSVFLAMFVLFLLIVVEEEWVICSVFPRIFEVIDSLFSITVILIFFELLKVVWAVVGCLFSALTTTLDIVLSVVIVILWQGVFHHQKWI